MFQDSDSKVKPTQGKDDKSSPSLATTPTLKLVVSNPDPVQEAPAVSQRVLSTKNFAAKVKKKGVNLYELNIRDPFHELGCDLILEIEKSMGKTVAVCHFPMILNKSNRFLNEDEELYGTIMLQFQLKVLEQLFMFCINHAASPLTIYMDDDQAEGFEIFDDFLSQKDETLTENGEKTEMVIPTDRESFDKWVTYVAEMNLKLEQDLWREQRTNSSIRHYLKSRPLA
ncbi:MAG: hypothetical protein ACOH2E_05505 [Candidatus Paracaedibacter sp.]